jgi:ribosomal protein S18 acetylase RimI-like enzyme
MGEIYREDIVAIKIKILNHSDVDILKNVDPDVFDNPIDIPRAIEFLGDPRHHVGVAIDGDLVIGFVSAVHYVHPDKHCPELWINEIGVAEKYQRQGIGKQLMNEIFGVGRELNCESAWVLTDRENTAAISLYSVVGNPELPTDHVMFSFDLGRSNS